MKKVKSLEETAIHEAGHVVASLILAEPFDFVTVVPGSEYFGVMKVSVDRVNYIVDNIEIESSESFDDIINNGIKVSMAGFVAEKKKFGKVSLQEFCSSGLFQGDFDTVQELLFRLHDADEETLSSEFVRLMLETEQLFENLNIWAKTEAIAKALYKSKTLTYKECLELYEA